MFLFIKGIFKLPIYWQAWVWLLMIVNGVGPLFFLSEKIALVTLSAMITGAIVGFALVHIQGFTKLLGLMHAPWVPMFALQILVLRQDEPQGDFALWLKASLAVTFISLVIDIIDVVQYFKGNKTDLLAG